MKRRRMKKFRIREISAVDRPAQQAALAVIMKGDGSDFFKAEAEVDEDGKMLSRPSKLRRKKTEKEDFNTDQPHSFADAIKRIRRDNPKMSRVEALRTARKNFSSLYQSYQSGDEADLNKANVPVEKSAAVLTFEKCVSDVQKRDRCSRLEALKNAAREFPSELSAYRSALA